MKGGVLGLIGWMCAVLSVCGEESIYNGMKYFGASGDWISVRLDGYSREELPCVYADGQKRKVIVRHEVKNFNADNYPFDISGRLTVRIRSWDGAFERELGSVTLPRFAWRFGQELSFNLDMEDIRPGAYVVTAEIPPLVRADSVFNPTNTASGKVGQPMLYGRNAMRLCVFPNRRLDGIFGVGNAMIHNYKHYAGSDLANILEAGELHPVIVGHSYPFQNAILGCPGTVDCYADGRGDAPESMANPLSNRYLDIFRSDSKERIREEAAKLGKRLAKDASVALATVGGEAWNFNRGSLIASVEADASYREWVRTRYAGDLEKANKVWGTGFASWDEVRQPIHVPDMGGVAKEGAAAIDWYAGSGKIGKGLRRYFKEHVELAMDWYRWRRAMSVELFTGFAAEAKKYDKKTFYGNNYAWPNFFTHQTFPTWEKLDALGIDNQYVCHFPRTLGSDDEMIEILEQVESLANGKPVYGREIYVQPHYPGEMAALQNWAMVAHGVNANFVFAWKPYSDHGPKVFEKGPRAWERKEDSVPMWFLIDTDGTRLPVYEGVRRSAEEIAKFHAKYDGLSVRRIRSSVGIYISDESSMYAMLTTGDEPYNAPFIVERNHIAAGLRRGGVRFEYFYDGTLDRLTPMSCSVLLVPPTPRIAPEAMSRLADYKKAGGKLVRIEKWSSEFLSQHAEIPRSAWWDGGQDKVEVVVRRQEKTGLRFVFVLNQGGKPGKGTLCGSDFDGVTTMTDALTGEKTGLSFALAEYGYRVLIMQDEAKGLSLGLESEIWWGDRRMLAGY